MLDPMNDGLPQRLARRLQEDKPGRRAYREMVSELAYGRHVGPPAWNARAAAVLVCFLPVAGRWCIPLTLRPGHMLDHAGQISFPGGTNEPGESPERCALREFEEELGVSSEGLEIIGQLSPLYVFASNFLVTPCVAVADTLPPWLPSPDEVERVLELPVDVLLDEHARGVHILTRRGFTFQTQHIQMGDDQIWGATGLMLAEAAQVVAEA